MRTIHPNEALAEGDQALMVGIVLKLVGRRQPNDLCGDQAACLMLGLEGVHQVGQLVMLLEDREDVFLLVLFVVLLHELADERGGMLEDFWADLLLIAQPPHPLFVNEQTAVENAMLFHQVFGGGHTLIRIDSVLALALRDGGCHHRQPRQQPNACRQDAAAVLIHLRFHALAPSFASEATGWDEPPSSITSSTNSRILGRSCRSALRPASVAR